MSIKQYIENDTQDGWIDFIIQTLQGSCDSLYEYEDEYKEQGYDENALYEALDANIMQCECCGWWVEVGEIEYDMTCEDCADD